MQTTTCNRIDAYTWEIPARGSMRVPGILYASHELLEGMDDKVFEQVCNVATLPGIQRASYAMPDAHWGYGFPIGGVAAFDPERGGVISAGGVGFDISCGVRLLHTGLTVADLRPVQEQLVNALFRAIPAGVGSEGRIELDDREMDAMLAGGAAWAVERGYGEARDLDRIEERGSVEGALPEHVSSKAKQRQRREIGTLGSGNHYLEVQQVVAIEDEGIARGFGLERDAVVVTIHCGSRGLGHQIGTEFLAQMAVEAPSHGIELPDRELACAPIRSELGGRYLGAMRAAIHCALANRQVVTHLARQVFAEILPQARLELLYDVSHNTCKEELHAIDGDERRVFVHRKGATRALPPGHPDLPDDLRPFGQPVLIGGSMGTASYVLAGAPGNELRSFSSACHGAGRSMSRHQARRRWRGRDVSEELEQRGILIRCPTARGVAEEAPGAYKDVTEVIESAHRAGLARKVARLEPLCCIKG